MALRLGPRKLARGRTSKVLENVVEVVVGDNPQAIRHPLFVELQPLLRKDAATIATALKSIVVDVLKTRPSTCPKMKVIHMVTGDGIATNAAACRRLFHSLAADERITYRLMVWCCATHQANLVVQVWCSDVFH